MPTFDPNSPGSHKRDEVRNRRREAATTQQERRNARTPAGQIAVLDKRLGAGQGAAKERKRLEKETG